MHRPHSVSRGVESVATAPARAPIAQGGRAMLKEPVSAVVPDVPDTHAPAVTTEAPSIMPPGNDPYTREALEQGLRASLGHGVQLPPEDATAEQMARHSERKFNDYLAKVASDPAAPSLPPAFTDLPEDSPAAIEARKNDPYAKLREEGAQNPDAVRKASPEKYLSTVKQIGNE